jgi:hypothetical protein
MSYHDPSLSSPTPCCEELTCPRNRNVVGQGFMETARTKERGNERYSKDWNGKLDWRDVLNSSDHLVSQTTEDRLQ